MLEMPHAEKERDLHLPPHSSHHLSSLYQVEEGSIQPDQTKITTCEFRNNKSYGELPQCLYRIVSYTSVGFKSTVRENNFVWWGLCLEPLVTRSGPHSH